MVANYNHLLVFQRNGVELWIFVTILYLNTINTHWLCQKRTPIFLNTIIFLELPFS